MDPSEIASLFTDALEKIEFYWNFFTVTMLVMVGWFVAQKEGISSSMRWLVVIGFLVLATMNVVGLWGAYGIAESLKQDLILRLRASAGTLPNTLREFEQMRTFTTMRGWSIGIHLLIGLALLYLVLHHRRNTAPGPTIVSTGTGSKTTAAPGRSDVGAP